MERLLLLAIVGISVTILMKNHRPEMVVPCGIVIGALLLALVLGEVTGVLDAIERLMERYQISGAYAAVLLKMVSIAYLSRFGSNLAREAGLPSVAEHLELGGRVLLIATALPSVVALLEVGVAMLEELL